MTSQESNTPFNFQCIDAIKVSLCIEKEGLGFYEKASKRAKAQKVKNAFARLAEEEKEHIRSLQEKARFLQPALSRKSEGVHVERYISLNLKGRVFPDLKQESIDLMEFENDAQALEMGIEAEKRSIEVLSRFLTEERKIDVRAIFMHLIVEEKRHLQTLEELQGKLAGDGP
ncbi:MAG: ferritin family protein [Nitrospinae bacterium]|nr:ferritin family protein [Nitrospinota bacterium]